MVITKGVEKAISFQLVRWWAKNLNEQSNNAANETAVPLEGFMYIVERPKNISPLSIASCTVFDLESTLYIEYGCLHSFSSRIPYLCHDEQSRRQTYPFHVKDQYWTRSYVNIFCQRPKCLVCHPKILMQNLIYFKSYRLFSVKNIILDFNKQIGTGKRLFHNFTPLHL